MAILNYQSLDPQLMAIWKFGKWPWCIVAKRQAIHSEHMFDATTMKERLEAWAEEGMS